MEACLYARPGAAPHDRLVSPHVRESRMSTVNCRSCGSPQLEVVLSLGQTPLANSLLTKAQLKEPEATYPLDLAFCRACSLLQITETVPPETLFRDYLYFSSFSDTMLKHSEELADELIASRGLNAQSLVVEVASNDGYLLQFYQRRGIPVLGIEPALNVAKVAVEEKHIPTITEFFGADLAGQLAAKGQQADVVHAHNVLAHVANLNDFVDGFERLLKVGGIVVVQVPYVKDLLDRCEFDTIYHEHLCYYSLTALDRLARCHGLMAQDARRVPIHGGSLRVQFGRVGEGEASQRVAELLQEEKSWDVDNVDVYRTFARRVAGVRRELRELLGDLTQKGKRLA